MPNFEGRAQILSHYLNSTPKLVAEEVDVWELAKETMGFSGAELAQVVNKARILAASSAATMIEKGH